MSLGLQLILSTTMVATPPACSWAHPGANPYRGDPVAALKDFRMPEATRAKLRALMSAHQPTDVALITRDDIAGAHGYTDLREMHSGRGRVCHGPVDRSAWSPQRQERGLVYCADDTCVIVPTICNNVSLVTRKPEDDEPLDIEPAAGPPVGKPDAAPLAGPLDADGPLEFLPPAAGMPDLPALPGSSDTAFDGGGSGGGDSGPVASGSGLPGLDGGGAPGGVVSPLTPGVPAGGAPPGPPPIIPPVVAVPEAPTAWLLAVGLAALAAFRRRRPRAREGSATR